MKIDGYEEISEEEHLKDSLADHLIVYEWKTEKRYWFKKAQKFPICFKDEHYKIEINDDMIGIYSQLYGDTFHFGFNASFPLLVKAVEKAKEVAKKNENRNQ